MIGVISDTHGLMRREALEALRGVETIVHAGDVGSPEVLAALREIAPVTAVCGNVDKGRLAEELPARATVRAGSDSIYVLHDVNELEFDPYAAGFRIVVSGHSHQPTREERGGVLFLNPGSAGPRRFRLPVTLARLERRELLWNVEFVQLG